MDMSQYLEIFIEESKEHLMGLNQSLLQLEKKPDDNSVLNEIFRVAHTLKGMAGTMGFNKMTKLTHDMENVLHALRNDEIKVNTKLVDILFKCLDALENYINNIINSGSEGVNEYQEIINALNVIITNKSCSEEIIVDKPEGQTKDRDNSLQPSIQRQSCLEVDQYEQNAINKAYDIGMNVLEITVILDKACLLKSARAFIIFQILEKNGEIIKSQPKVEDIEDEKFDYQFTIIVVTRQSKEFFYKEINSVSEVEQVIIAEVAATEAPSGDEAKKEKAVQDSVQVSAATEENKEKEDGAKAAAKQKTGKTVRVDIDRLDTLMNLVSELIIQKTRLEGLDVGEKSQKYNEIVEYLERITTDLNDAVMKVRMVPVETVFNRFPRMIRDITKGLGKEIELIMSGEETELDRTVIDEIGDPLIHLLRNSVDHGIEPPQKRKEIGKPEVGHISLKAYQAGNSVLIEVSDDGQGINVDRVKAKAVERGLVSKDIANNLSKKDIINFLFQPSFSTADKVTDLSGRGVGLDVVKTKIEALGGVVEVESETGKGTKFIIQLPLTLSIIQALLVMVGSEKYAIPLNSIKQIINISPDDIKLVQKQEVILLRNMVVPIVRLDKLLEVPKDDKQQKQLTVVIVRKGEKLSGFLVDSLIGQQEIVIKTLGKLLSGIKTIAGATILGDGNVALILDVNSLA